MTDDDNLLDAQFINTYEQAPNGAIKYAGMTTQEIDWAACRVSMADYLQNSFLVIDDEDDD